MGQLDQFCHKTANPFLFVIHKLDYMGILSFYVLLDARTQLEGRKFGGDTDEIIGQTN